MYNYIGKLFFVAFVIVPISISIYLSRVIEKTDMKLEHEGQSGVVRYPFWIYILGLFGSVILTILLINNFETENMFMRIFFVSFTFIANCLMYFQLSYRIYYGDGNITYIVFLRKRKYRIEDIIDIEERNNATIIRFKDGRKIDFDTNLCEGDINFIRYLNGLPPIEI